MSTKKATEPVVQLSTRLPASLLKRLKIHCVQRQQTVQDFVREAITERLRRGAGRRE
jgi:predicted DNA-binding protein